MKKVLLIMPDAHMHKLRFGPMLKSLREAPLTLTTLAAMADRSRFDVTIVDESIDVVPKDQKYDLIGISVLTGTAYRAYRFADYFRKIGIPVVLGGAHVTILPEEAAKHADSIIIGMAENTWPKLLNDFYEGKLLPRYEDDDLKKQKELTGVPLPRTDLQRRSGYVLPDTVQATRGCVHRCDFCAVTAVWPKYYRRPIGDVIRDIKALPGRRIVFNDVSLVDDVKYAKELFSAMIPLNKLWGGLATVRVTEDKELLDLMCKSGCRFLLIGFESFKQESLKHIGKGFNRHNRYEDLMKELHSRNISVQGTMIFGFDEDAPDIFAETVERVQELKIDIPRYSIYTPYPGTKLYDRLKSEDRILSYNWEDYDTMHVVHQPLHMSPEELFKGFKWAYEETFKVKNIARRLSPISFNSVINFMGNLTYKLFIERLKKDPRFAQPYGFVDSREL